MGAVNQRVTPIDSKGVPRARVPQYINIEPVAVIAAAATGTVLYTVGPRNFVMTGWGFTSQEVGVPAARMPFKLNIQDIGGSIFFAPIRFLVNCIVGPMDKDYVDLPVPWRFEKNTTISCEFENIGAQACLPYLVLVGYLE